MSKVIKTKRPDKGDLVVGHRVWAIMPGNLPAIQGEIVDASPTKVVMEVSDFLSALGLPKRSQWSWREKVGAFQQKGQRTSKGWGLVLDSRPKDHAA